MPSRHEQECDLIVPAHGRLLKRRSGCDVDLRVVLAPFGAVFDVNHSQERTPLLYLPPERERERERERESERALAQRYIPHNAHSSPMFFSFPSPL